MEEYICKIASLEEINKKWDYQISINPDDEKWIRWKKEALENFSNKTRICYMGILNGEIITEATATISEKDAYMQNKDKLIDDTTVYLSAFRTNKEYDNMGYFSKLYKFMESDLKKKGYKRLTLGVEPNEVRNIMIYFHWGFTNYLKTGFEKYDENEIVLVNYYAKDL